MLVRAVCRAPVSTQCYRLFTIFSTSPSEACDRATQDARPTTYVHAVLTPPSQLQPYAGWTRTGEALQSWRCVHEIARWVLHQLKRDAKLQSIIVHDKGWPTSAVPITCEDIWGHLHNRTAGRQPLPKPYVHPSLRAREAEHMGQRGTTHVHNTNTATNSQQVRRTRHGVCECRCALLPVYPIA